MQRVSEMTKANFMFQSLSAQQKEQIFQVMSLRRVKAGDMIIREGDEGDEMYIIDSGTFEVLKRDENAINQCVFTYTTEGAAFGELSLMYGKPRAASVRAKTDGTLWSIGRLAFRAVLMKRRTVNLLKSLRLLHIFKGLSVPKLQRLAESCTEETFNNREQVVSSKSVQGTSRWILMVVLEGALVLEMKDKTRKNKTRAEGASLGVVELERNVGEVYAHGKTKIARIPESIFLDIMGGTKSQEIIDMAKSPRLVRQASIFSTPDKIKLEQGHSPADYSLEAHVIVQGEYAYVGNFRGKLDRRVNSIKVISKKKASDHHIDQNLLNERVFLAAMQGTSEFIPRVVATFQNDQIVHLVYDDVIECDLAHALSEGITTSDKLVYCAALYSGLQALHEHGLMHRFLNPSGVYVSATKRLPILADLRYAKKMDGSKAFTICGDPLFFPPEMVGQAGYDYSADLWSLGVLAYEIFEVCVEQSYHI
jgi:CRP-like cAMP-binding protein